MNLEGIRDKVVALVGTLGGAGLFLISFLDSSVMTFPVINDLLLVDFSIRNPAGMPYYALMATLGSVAGCVLLYFIARKGGEAVFHRRAGPHAASVKAWIEHNGFISVLVAALLPPPTPFKVFVIAAGVFEVPLRSFVTALTLARALRYFGIGFLAVKYGATAMHYLTEHKLRLTGIVLGLVLLSYVLAKLFVGRHPKRTAQ
jgi:membrane protein YqaA with SNARE-associated domain